RVMRSNRSRRRSRPAARARSRRKTPPAVRAGSPVDAAVQAGLAAGFRETAFHTSPNLRGRPMDVLILGSFLALTPFPDLSAWACRPLFDFAIAKRPGAEGLKSTPGIAQAFHPRDRSRPTFTSSALRSFRGLPSPR